MTSFLPQASRSKMTSFRGHVGWVKMISFRGLVVGQNDIIQGASYLAKVTISSGWLLIHRGKLRAISK